MTGSLRVWIAGVTVLAMGGLIYTSNQPEAQAGGKDVKSSIIKIAAAIKSGDTEGAKKMAAATAKGLDEIGDLMHMFRPRSKGGVGVGAKAGSNPAKDGIEVKLRDLARDVPTGIAKEADALEETGYYIAAIAAVSAAKAPDKNQGKKTKKAWTDWSKDMGDAGIGFAKASAAKGGQEIKTAAAKVNAACNSCHSVFKE